MGTEILYVAIVVCASSFKHNLVRRKVIAIANWKRTRIFRTSSD